MRAELRRAFTSPGFWGAALVMFFCLQGYALPVYLSQAHGIHSEPVALRESALALSLGGIFFGGMILLLPFCSSLAYAGSQVDDIRTGFLSLDLLRSSFQGYACRKVITAFVCAFAAAFGAFIAHASLWHLIAVPYDPVRYPNHEIPFWEESYFHQWAQVAHGWPIILNIGFGLAFTSGVWSVVALAAAAWVPDKLLVCVIPACLNKLWSANLAFYLFGVWLPSPDALFNDAQTVTGDLRCLVAFAIVLALAVMGYGAGLKRRAWHA